MKHCYLPGLDRVMAGSNNMMRGASSATRGLIPKSSGGRAALLGSSVAVGLGAYGYERYRNRGSNALGNDTRPWE